MELVGDWSSENVWAVLQGVKKVAGSFAELSQKSASQAFSKIFGLTEQNPLRFEWNPNCLGCRETPGAEPAFGYTNSRTHIEFASMSQYPEYAIRLLRKINNVIHELGHAFNVRLGRTPENALTTNLLQRPAGFYGSANSFTWVQSPQVTRSEIFADMFIGWSYGLWGNDVLGPKRAEFMTAMYGWVAQASVLP